MLLSGVEPSMPMAKTCQSESVDDEAGVQA